MPLKVTGIYAFADQNVPVEDSRYFTVRPGIGLHADVPNGEDLIEAAKQLQAMAEKLLTDAIVVARKEAQVRLHALAAQANDRVREESELM